MLWSAVVKPEGSFRCASGDMGRVVTAPIVNQLDLPAVQPAVHIFGVHQGTCPPGTYLKTAPGSGTNVSLGNLTAGTPAQIQDLHLVATGGKAIELSTQFEPNTTVYGAMVREVSLEHSSLDVTVHANVQHMRLLRSMAGTPALMCAAAEVLHRRLFADAAAQQSLPASNSNSPKAGDVRHDIGDH